MAASPAARGARPWRSPMPKSIPTASPASFFAQFFLARTRGPVGVHRRAEDVPARNVRGVSRPPSGRPNGPIRWRPISPASAIPTRRCRPRRPTPGSPTNARFPNWRRETCTLTGNVREGARVPPTPIVEAHYIRHSFFLQPGPDPGRCPPPQRHSRYDRPGPL